MLPLLKTLQLAQLKSGEAAMIVVMSASEVALFELVEESCLAFSHSADPGTSSGATRTLLPGEG